MVKAAALAEAAAVVVVVVFRAVIITSLGRGGGGSCIGSGCKDKIKGQGLWAGSFQPAGCHYLSTGHQPLRGCCPKRASLGFAAVPSL